ncbi:hypothetical protein ACIRBY_24875 [Streptomyces sp. NPDC096136]|uniref:hypothetical protein n=1 Tax=Streptomyces sp. NPDC096136 TaxID=3366076 RepID=UPI0038203C10
MVIPIVPTTLRPCRACGADEERGQARTVVIGEDRLLVTWHLSHCPHYLADFVLADRDS